MVICVNIDIDIDKAILEDIDIDKAILKNIDICGDISHDMSKKRVNLSRDI